MARSADTQASTYFIVPHRLYAIEKPYTIDLVSLTLPTLLSTNIHLERRNIDLHDVRNNSQELDIESHPFRYFKHESKNTHISSEAEMARPYAVEMNQVIKRRFGSENVYCIDFRVSYNHDFLIRD